MGVVCREHTSGTQTGRWWCTSAAALGHKHAPYATLPPKELAPPHTAPNHVAAPSPNPATNPALP
jgi:hypothetical protein